MYFPSSLSGIGLKRAAKAIRKQATTGKERTVKVKFTIKHARQKASMMKCELSALAFNQQ